MAWLSEQCILGPLNKIRHTINAILAAQLPGKSVKYRLDSVFDESQVVYFSLEFLNSLEVSGFPSHMLSLQISAPIILLQSLDPY